jgi:hypothetical protein
LSAGAAQVRTSWLLLVLATLLGFAAVVAPAERRLAAIEAHTAQLGDLATQNEAALTRLDSLERTRARVRSDVKRLAGKGSSGKVAVAVLKVLETEAARNHLTISSIVPSSDGPAARPASLEEDVAITLQGRYRDAMAAIAQLPREDVLVEVQSVSLVSVTSHQAFPYVDATIHAALYYGIDELTKEEKHALTPAH